MADVVAMLQMERPPFYFYFFCEADVIAQWQME